MTESTATSSLEDTESSVFRVLRKFDLENSKFWYSVSAIEKRATEKIEITSSGRLDQQACAFAAGDVIRELSAMEAYWDPDISKEGNIRTLATQLLLRAYDLNITQGGAENVRSVERTLHFTWLANDLIFEFWLS